MMKRRKIERKSGIKDEYEGEDGMDVVGINWHSPRGEETNKVDAN